jgi:hypothetical protein
LVESISANRRMRPNRVPAGPGTFVDEGEGVDGGTGKDEGEGVDEGDGVDGGTGKDEGEGLDDTGSPCGGRAAHMAPTLRAVPVWWFLV